MEDALLSKMFEYERWCELLDKADEKGINKTVLRKMATPQVRLALYEAIKNNRYEIRPPRILLIPKPDTTEMRRVYANEDEDRIVCTLVNDCMMEIFKEFIHPSCVSYQKGIGCQDIVQRVSNEVVKLGKKANGKQVGTVSDFSKFFDNVSIEAIDECFDRMETKLGFEIGTEPVINMMRKYYHNELYFDEFGELQSKFQSLKQGCAVAAMLSCMVLYDLDEYMTKTSLVYYRYSDDCLTLREDVDGIVDDINGIVKKYNVQLNPRKIKPVYDNQFFQFLGFYIKGNQITLRRDRVKKLTKEIVDATIKKPNITPAQAKQNIKRIIYGDGDGYSFATSAFGAMQNCDKDVETLNNFIMDCIRLCEIRYNYNKERKTKGLKPKQIKYGMNDVGGIGVVTDKDDYTFIRGKGSKIRTAKQRTQKEIDHYKSVGCLLKCYKLGKPIYEATIRGI